MDITVFFGVLVFSSDISIFRERFYGDMFSVY